MILESVTLIIINELEVNWNANFYDSYDKGLYDWLKPTREKISFHKD